MRSLPQAPQQSTSTWTKSEDRNDAKRLSGYSSGGRPSISDDRSFELFENKAEVTILNSEADDRLAAAMYGGAKRLKKKDKKQKKQKKRVRVSGYDFDSLLKEESSSSYSEHF